MLRIVVVGLVAGFLSGLFGVGGGILIVPALVLVLGFDQRLAHGTSLAAVLPIAISSLTSYALEDKVDWRAGVLLAVGAVVGAVVGTHFLQRLPHDALAIAFAVLLVATAIRLLVDHSEATGRSPLDLLGFVMLLVVGLVSGILAGLLGVGGGIIMVPAMVVGYGIPAAIAKGTSLFVIVPTSIMGTWRNRSKKNADLRVAMILGFAGVLSAFVAGKISVGMSESLSNILFAILLLVVAVRMMWQLLGERRHDDAAPA
ncbi:MAG TPA: sulfite exporter TauE/SafE family protein [Ilumatobacteraceae bacterium]